MCEQDHAAPASLGESLRLADRDGRTVVTRIAGRVAILLPPTVEATAELLATVLRAVEDAINA
jgi:hypothetical protein